jgi:Fur family ferric uptake transcriptional regulator
MGTNAKDILKSHHLRITDCRLDVLGHFARRGHALSQGDLEEALGQYDRVTLYRTLHSFLEAGILHKIPNETGAATYGLCHHTCSPHEHSHDHIHFKCNNCGHIECFDDRHVPRVEVPAGYKVATINLIIDGLCAQCA